MFRTDPFVFRTDPFATPFCLSQTPSGQGGSIKRIVMFLYPTKLRPDGLDVPIRERDVAFASVLLSQLITRPFPAAARGDVKIPVEFVTHFVQHLLLCKHDLASGISDFHRMK